MHIPSISRGRTPAVCAASRIKRMPRARQTAPICATGSTVPQTLLAWSMTTAFVEGRIRSSRSFRLIEPSAAQGTRSKRTPCFSSWRSGRMTALCSMEETRTWSPCLRNPLSRMLRLSVTFFVKTTRFGPAGSFPQPNRRHRNIRVSYTIRHSCRGRRCTRTPS